MPLVTLKIAPGKTKQFPFVWKVPGSPDESFLTDNSRATAIIRCAYNQRHQLIDALTGYSCVTIERGKRVLRRVTPFQYPYHPGLYCVGSPRNVGLSPYGGYLTHYYPFPFSPSGFIEIPGYGEPDYLDAEVTLLFTTLPYKVKEDNDVDILSQDHEHGWTNLPDEGDALSRGHKRFIWRQGKPAGKLITVPGNYLYYRHSGRPIPQSSATFFQFAMDIVYTWFQIPEDALPIEAWATIPNCVNHDTFDGFEAETLLCQQPTFKTNTSPFGVHQCDVSYTMRYLPNFYAPVDPDTGEILVHLGSVTGHNWLPTIGQPSIAGYPEDPEIEQGMLIFREVCTRGNTPDLIVNPGPGQTTRPGVPLNGTPPHPLADFRNLFRPRQSGPALP